MPIALIPTYIFKCNFAYFAVYRVFKLKNCIGKAPNQRECTLIYMFGYLYEFHCNVVLSDKFNLVFYQHLFGGK